LPDARVRLPTAGQGWHWAFQIAANVEMSIPVKYPGKDASKGVRIDGALCQSVIVQRNPAAS
jgi:hypothetical protein